MGALGTRVRVQVSKREFHTYIHLDETKVEFLSYNKYIYIYIYISNTHQPNVKSRALEAALLQAEVLYFGMNQ